MLAITTTRVCAEPGCPALAVSSTRCAKHKLPGHGRPHRRASDHVMTATHCAVCHQPFAAGRTATRGHIVALENGGRNEPGNYQAECEACNKGRHGS